MIYDISFYLIACLISRLAIAKRCELSSSFCIAIIEIPQRLKVFFCCKEKGIINTELCFYYLVNHTFQQFNQTPIEVNK